MAVTVEADRRAIKQRAGMTFFMALLLCIPVVVVLRANRDGDGWLVGVIVPVVLMMAAASVASLLQLLSRAPGLVADDQGIRLRSVFSVISLNWSEIAEVRRAVARDGSPALRVIPRSDSTFFAQCNPVLRLVNRVLAPKRSRTFLFSQRALAVRLQAVERAFREHGFEPGEAKPPEATAQDTAYAMGLFLVSLLLAGPYLALWVWGRAPGWVEVAATMEGMSAAQFWRTYHATLRLRGTEQSRAMAPTELEPALVIRFGIVAQSFFAAGLILYGGLLLLR